LEEQPRACPPEGWRASSLAGDYRSLLQHLITTGSGSS
ncbi:MAG TPA: DUF3524 domain-containing protein, partial [Marinobacter adhaerens]|nr:DUF3524 domain-containing protein [Marinobacter adhaerens]